MDIYERVGSRIREARIRREVNAKQLAGILDCSPASVSNYEKAKRWISLVDLEMVAEFLGEPLSYFIEENPGKRKNKPPQPITERKILNAIKNLEAFDYKKHPEKVVSVFHKTLGAKYTFLFLMKDGKGFEFGGMAGIKKGLLKKLQDLLSINLLKLKFKPDKKMNAIFKNNRPLLTSDIPSLLNTKRLALFIPSLLALAKFEAVMLLPLKANHVPVGFIAACFSTTREAERFRNSELLTFFNQYVAQILENARLAALGLAERRARQARLLEEAREKKQKVRTSYKIEVEGKAPRAREEKFTSSKQPITS